MKVFTDKVPKVVVAAVDIVTTALRSAVWHASPLYLTQMLTQAVELTLDIIAVCLVSKLCHLSLFSKHFPSFSKQNRSLYATEPRISRQDLTVVLMLTTSWQARPLTQCAEYYCLHRLSYVAGRGQS